METTSTSSVPSTLISVMCFAGTSLATILSLRKIYAFQIWQSSRFSTTSWQRHYPSKDKILALREKFFSKSQKVSYANSGPLMIVQGQGSYLMDDSGQWYLDTRNNVAHCGHNHKKIVNAIIEQVQCLNTNMRYLHPNVAQLAERLITDYFRNTSLSVVFFCNSGSEANDMALRLARAYTHSNNTIVVEGAYHGHTLSTLDVSPYKYTNSLEFECIDSQHQPKLPTPGGHIKEVPCPDTYRGKHRNRESAGEEYAAYVWDACQSFQDAGEKVRAFIVEGGMSVAGVVIPPPGYLRACAEAIHNAGGLYIADEIQTGFGRLGSCYWAYQYRENLDDEPVVPDIVTLGKPFGNGMPLAAVVTSRKIATAFEACDVEYFNTFGGNPVCAAAGLAVLDVMETEKLQDHALHVGNYLKTGFVKIKERLPLIGDVRGAGLFLGVELVRNTATLEPATEETSFLCSVLKAKYMILTSIDGFHDNVLVIKPPMSFSVEDADQFLNCFEQALTEDLPSASDLAAFSRTPT